ncbi:hypothetical protein HY500_01255 [Candidatus Woesearchaeota archaeon]|nr:hypothetical protein [Candidatus Woesearchaeota archaeon]
MLTRWNTKINDLNLFLSTLQELLPEEVYRQKRGKPSKINPIFYMILIIAKEFKRKTLRSAETDLSELICKQRVDHSVIAYLEKKPEIAKQIRLVVHNNRYILEQHLSSLFSVIDATEFTTWHKEEINFHLHNIICEETVCPIGISFLTGGLASPVEETIDPGGGMLYADPGYDDNASMGIMFKRGYTL